MLVSRATAQYIEPYGFVDPTRAFMGMWSGSSTITVYDQWCF